MDDINDNCPEIFFADSKSTIEIWESEIATLFTSSELSVNDRDLGSHAIYSMSLSPIDFSEAFNIIPTNGYQLQNFTISVVNTQLLDFEEERWQNFSLTVISYKHLDLYMMKINFFFSDHSI